MRVRYLLRFWRSNGVLNLNTHFYSVVFDLFCIFRENTNEQQLIQAKILYQCPSRNILDFVYGGSHFSTGVIFLRVRHVKNRPLWHFFYTWDTFFYGQGSFLYDEEWPLGRFSTGVVIRRYTAPLQGECLIAPTISRGGVHTLYMYIPVMPSLHLSTHEWGEYGECWRVCNWTACPGLGFHQLFIVLCHKKHMQTHIIRTSPGVPFDIPPYLTYILIET